MAQLVVGHFGKSVRCSSHGRMVKSCLSWQHFTGREASQVF